MKKKLFIVLFLICGIPVFAMSVLFYYNMIKPKAGPGNGADAERGGEGYCAQVLEPDDGPDHDQMDESAAFDTLPQIADENVQVPKEPGVLFPEKGQMAVLSPFMERNGYRDGRGWWVKISE